MYYVYICMYMAACVCECNLFTSIYSFDRSFVRSFFR